MYRISGEIFAGKTEPNLNAVDLLQESIVINYFLCPMISVLFPFLVFLFFFEIVTISFFGFLSLF